MNYKIMGMKLPMFAVVAVIVIGASYLGVLPGGLVGCMAYMMVLGAIFGVIGDNCPIVKDYLGGGSVVAIFGAAAMATYGLMPEKYVENVTIFFTGTGDFVNFALCALIAGSIMSMDRDLLRKAAVRYLPVLVAAQIIGCAVVGLVGLLVGYSSVEAILYIGIPVMGGGLGAGAVPLSEMFANVMNVDAASILSKMTPAVSLGNAIAIVTAGILDKVAKSKQSWTGNGQLMPSGDGGLKEAKREQASLDYGALGRGLLVAVCFFILARGCAKIYPTFHAYAYMVVLLIIAKLTGIVPKEYEDDCFYFYNAVIKNTSRLLLVGIGVALIDLPAVISAITPIYILLTAVVVVSSLIGAMIVGKLVGFYPVEAGISAGLCSANMGGSGDIATLGACNRMVLLPFAQISSRIGGSIILILGSLLVQILK